MIKCNIFSDIINGGGEMAETGANSPVGRGAQPQSSTVPYDTNALLCEYQ